MPTDVRLKQTFDPYNVAMDFFLKSDGTLDESEELATAVRVALGTDRLANQDEILPDPDSTDRRGWWGDMDAETVWDGWPIGTKNWLLTRAKITPAPAEEGETLERARIYTLSALQPFIDRRVASRVSVTVERAGTERINVFVQIYRGPKEEIALRYQVLWQDLEAALAPYTYIVPIDFNFTPLPGTLILIYQVPRVDGPKRFTPTVRSLTLSSVPPSRIVNLPLSAIPSRSLSLTSAAPARSIVTGPYLTVNPQSVTLVALAPSCSVGPAVSFAELREDGSKGLREDGSIELGEAAP